MPFITLLFSKPSRLYKAAIIPRRPRTAAPETAVGIAPLPEEVELVSAEPALLVRLPATPDAVLTAVLKIEVTPDIFH